MKKLIATAAIAAVALSLIVAAPADAASARATITGRAYSDRGTPIDGLTVTSGSRSDTTDRTGKFVITGIVPGTHTVRFSDPVKHRYLTEYLGDSATSVGADTITLRAGEKHTGVSEHLTHAAIISGVVTINGENADVHLGAVAVTLTDASGAVINSDDVTRSTFAFPGLPAGRYTLTAAQDDSDYPRVVPQSKTVEVIAGQQLNDARLELQLVRGVVQRSYTAASVKHVGSKMKISVRVTSYVSVAGGVVTLKYHGALHRSTTLGASGAAVFTISTASWEHGDRARVDVLFDGPIGVAESKAVTRFTVR